MNSDITPQPKVIAGGIAGSITVVLLWVLRQYAGVEVPQEVAAAVTTIFGFAAAYLTSNK
jgi:putative flippase GtrA